MRRFSLLLAALLVLPPAQGRAFSNPEPSSTVSPASDQLLARGGRGVAAAAAWAVVAAAGPHGATPAWTAPRAVSTAATAPPAAAGAAMW